MTISSTTTRRHFLGGTLGISLLAPFVNAAEEAPVGLTIKRKLKTGFVGMGSRGLWIAKMFLEHGGYEPVTVANYFPDVSINGGKELGENTALKMDLSEMNA